MSPLTRQDPPPGYISLDDHADQTRPWPPVDDDDDLPVGGPVSAPVASPQTDPGTSPKKRGLFADVFLSGIRGTAQGANEATTMIARDVGGTIAKHTRLYKVGADDDEQAAFLDWQEGKGRADIIPDSFIPGPSQGVLGGLVEGAAQFLVGFFGPGKIAKGWGIGKKAVTQVATRGMARGAVADVAAFDPWEERISDLVESGPGWVSNPLTRYLSADEEDAVALGRFKNALEGTLLGTGVEFATFGIRAARVRRQASQNLISEREAAIELNRLAEEAHVLIEEAEASDMVDLVVNGDGTSTVTIRDAEGLDSVIREAGEEAGTPTAEGVREITLENPQQAEKVAASLNNILKARAPRQGPRLDDAQAESIRTALMEKLETGDLGEGWEGFAGGLDINFNLTGDADAHALFNSISEAIRPVFEARTNRTREGGGIPHAATEAAAERWLKNIDSPGVRERLRDDVDFSTDLWVRGVAYDAVLQAHAQRTLKWARSAAGLDDAFAMAEWRRAVQDLADFELDFSTLNTNVARYLDSRKIKVGPIDPSGKPGSTGKPTPRAKPKPKPKTTRASQEGQRAGQELDKVQTELEKLLEQAKKNPESITKATEGVSADNFIDSRAYQRAKNALDTARRAAKALERDLPQDVVDTARKARSERIKAEAKKMDETANKVVTEEGMGAEAPPQSRNPIEDLSRQIEAERRHLDHLEEVRGRGEDARVDKAARDAQRKQLEDAGLDAAEIDEALNAGERTAFNTIRETQKLDPFHGMTKEQMNVLVRGMVLLEDSESLVRAIRGLDDLNKKVSPDSPDYWDHFNTYRTNMMLYGGETHVVNVLSTAVMAGLRPLERTAGGLLTGDLQKARFGADWAQNMAHHTTILESLRQAGRAWKSGEPILGSRIFDENAEKYLSGQKGEELNNLAALVGTLVTVPRRLMITADEFAKQLTYRGNVFAQAASEARSRGLTDPEDIASYARQTVDGSMDARGGARNMVAMGEANYATFQNSLERPTHMGHRTFGEILQQGAQMNHGLRFIAPFVRTPVNLMRAHLDRLPVVGAVQKQMLDDFAAGGVRRSDAIAKQVTGAVVYGSAYALYQADLLTGNGPMNPVARKMWIDEGRAPYSVKVGGKWISYRRMDPIFTGMGVMADALTTLEHLTEGQAEDMAAVMGAALFSSFTNRSYTVGITDALEAAASGDPRVFSRFLAGATASLVPGFVRQNNPDPVWRDAQNYIQMVKAQIPGLSKTLEPSRNYLGEVSLRSENRATRGINPFYASNTLDPILEEINSLGVEMSLPNHRIGEGVKKINLKDRKQWDNGTGQSPYDRWMELMSETPNNSGQTLRQELRSLIATPEWRQMSPGSPLYPGGEKAIRVRAIMNAHRTTAYFTMLREYPTLGTAVLDDTMGSANSLFNIR